MSYLNESIVMTLVGDELFPAYAGLGLLNKSDALPQTLGRPLKSYRHTLASVRRSLGEGGSLTPQVR